ncbi:hypothetical protein ACFVHW_22780 [Streptomyces sp. NPDC127110]|uniref:hypothetical protein n=1 Tax=Streptomyces sp. NPDC127110 TaxID=3345362 RepID=UPI00363BA1F8
MDMDQAGRAGTDTHFDDTQIVVAGTLCAIAVIAVRPAPATPLTGPTSPHGT